MATFRTTVRQTGKESAGIEIPPSVIEGLGGTKVPRVVVSVNAYAYRSTVGIVDGKPMVSFSAEHRAASGIRGGDEVEVQIELDTQPRTVDVPPDLAAALDAEPAARATFDRISNSNKGWHVSQVTSAKTEETRQRRIARSVEMLREGRAR